MLRPEDFRPKTDLGGTFPKFCNLLLSITSDCIARPNYVTGVTDISMFKRIAQLKYKLHWLHQIVKILFSVPRSANFLKKKKRSYNMDKNNVINKSGIIFTKVQFFSLF